MENNKEKNNLLRMKSIFSDFVSDKREEDVFDYSNGT